jgi:hypothetical protein
VKEIRIRWIRRYDPKNLPYDCVWVVEIPENVWKEVSEWYRKYIRHSGVSDKHHRIWVRTLGHLMDLIRITSEVS